MERGMSSRVFPSFLLNQFESALRWYGLNSFRNCYSLENNENVVGKHHITGSKESVIITSLIGLCDAEG